MLPPCHDHMLLLVTKFSILSQALIPPSLAIIRFCGEYYSYYCIIDREHSPYQCLHDYICHLGCHSKTRPQVSRLYSSGLKLSEELSYLFGAPIFCAQRHEAAVGAFGDCRKVVAGGPCDTRSATADVHNVSSRRGYVSTRAACDLPQCGRHGLHNLTPDAQERPRVHPRGYDIDRMRIIVFFHNDVK